MSLKYEPASKPLHISVEWFFLNSEMYRTGTALAHQMLTAYLPGLLSESIPLCRPRPVRSSKSSQPPSESRGGDSPASGAREIIFIALLTCDRNPKASREGSK